MALVAFSLRSRLVLLVHRLGASPYRPVPFLFAATLVLAAYQGKPRSPVLRRTEGLVNALAGVELQAGVDGVTWIDLPPTGTVDALIHPRRALVRARLPGEPTDLYLVRARILPGERFFELESFHNLTHTPSADESVPLLDRNHAVYTTAVDGVTTTVFALDLSHAPLAPAENLTRLGRLQTELSFLQETGQVEGIGRLGWTFDPAPTSVQLKVQDGQIAIVADGRAIRLPLEGTDPIEGKVWVRPHRTVPARPGNLVTWAVDRVRGLSWFGDRRMQALKALAFEVKDVVARNLTPIVGDRSEREIRADLGGLATAPPVAHTDPETGWPPAPMKPFLTPPLEGEGEWMALENDPFIPSNPGAPPAFVTSFVRADRERKYTRIYVTVWDPRQVQMHMMAGTVEPIGASGETGPGLIPRTPEVLGRLVGAMNGGFQALHGEFGMMGDGVVYLPPKPFAATVAELRDGSTGFGSWPKEPEIPDWILSYRQNLTVLVKDEKFNPYNRTWWGGTPPDQTDKVHTVRSGICLTREDFVAYFYGQEIAAEVLAQAMIQARCKVAIHLDMNAGHTGLEFYRVGPASQLGPIGRPLQGDWEAEGAVPHMDGWRFRGRRMIRSMPLMNFPRYIHREARDFLYLTLRNILPGPDIPGVAEAESRWSTHDVAQHGFPAAVATATVHPDPTDPSLAVRLLQVDPRMVETPGAPGVAENAPTVVSLTGIARSRGTRPSLWLSRGAFSIALEPPEEGMELFTGVGPRESPAKGNVAAVGIRDDSGMLLYAATFIDAPTDAGAHGSAPNFAAALDRLLIQLGCSSRMVLSHPLGVDFGGAALGEVQAPMGDQAATLRLVRAKAPGARTIFDDTPIVSPEVWRPLQLHRIRYFKKPAPAPSATSSPRESGNPAETPVGTADSLDGVAAAPAKVGGSAVRREPGGPVPASLGDGHRTVPPAPKTRTAPGLGRSGPG